MSEQRAYYVGFDTCGCAVAIVLDEPRFRKHIADDVAQMIRNGYVVERMKECPQLVWDCPHRIANVA